MDRYKLALAFSTALVGLGLATSVSAATLPATTSPSVSLAVVADVPLLPASRCSTAGAKGRYGYSEHGMFMPNGANSQPEFHFVEVGQFTLDGLGQGNGVANIAFNGQPYLNIPLTSITYQVNADCTGTASFVAGGDVNNPRTITFVISDQGSQIDYISTTPGSTLVGVARRQ